eukprot:6010382-Karenia_brevis.AAC.1
MQPEDLDGKCTSDDVSFVDDAVFFVFADAAGVASAASVAMNIISVAFHLHGLTLNFKDGKSNAIFQFNGKGAPSARKHLMCDCGAKLDFVGLAGVKC